MILRSLLLLGVGAAIACAPPAFAAGTSASPDSTPATTALTPQVAALETETPKAETAVPKKPKAKAAKKTAKKVAKAKKKPAAEEPKEEKQGFFDRLFGGDIKQKPKEGLKKEAKKAKPIKVAAKAREKAKPVEEVEDPTLPAIVSNSGELRSEAKDKKPTLFAGLFGGETQQMLPETRALDRVLEKKQSKKTFKVKAEFVPQEVEFSGYDRGTIVIDTAARFLYLVEDSSTARRYAIAVGREGLQFKGAVKVGDKQEWPRWIPTKEMQQREPKKYGQYKDGMDGGPENPLGARAIYLYLGKQDTHLRIHGTNQPQSIGTSASNGCFRMINDHVIDLYRRVKVGTPVVVL
jgi:lipoprotein-anchoring transpeptidase ErfK/SrfK